jgi:hypothetical protein
MEISVGFEVVTVMTINITLFWDVTPCSFRGNNVSEEPTAPNLILPGTEWEQLPPTNRYKFTSL